MEHSRAESAPVRVKVKRATVGDDPRPAWAIVETDDGPMKPRAEIVKKLELHDEQAELYRGKIAELRAKEQAMTPPAFKAIHGGELPALLRQYAYECASAGALRYVLEA